VIDAERSQAADRTPLHSLLAPRSIAVVGASPTSYVGRVILENLRALGFPGAVYPVNPRYEEVMGWRCYPSLDSLPDGPEAVVAAVPHHLVSGVLDGAGKRGARAAVVPGGGFTETGPDALKSEEEIAAVARRYGMAVCGPNCMGVISPGQRSALYIGTIPESVLPGRVALVSQSGSVVEAAVNMGPRIGFSALVSCGNEAVVTIGDYLEHFADDPGTGAVAVFLEGFRDPAGFVQGARALRAAGKPLAVLQAGRSREAAAAIAAHSGSLAGTEEVITGLLHQIGAIGVDDLDELFEVAEVLGHGRLPRGRRLFVVTDSGGEANLVTDHAARVGLELPEPSPSLVASLQARWPNFSYVGNPIDPWGVDPEYVSLYREILGGAAEEDVDVVVVALDKVTTWAGENEVHLGVAAAEALIAATAPAADGDEQEPSKLPVFLTIHATGAAAASVREPLRSAGVPLLHGLRPAMVALRRAWWWGTWKARTEPFRSGRAAPPALGSAAPVLSERVSREVLAAYGIPLVPAVPAATGEEAVRAAEGLGFPVVVKADVAGVAHKAAAGLVSVNVATPDAVRRAFDAVTSRASDAEGALVEATASGVELICGMRRDPMFGPVVLLGVGGALTEVLREVAVRVCPLSAEDLPEMLDECAAGRLLRAAGVDPAAVLDVVTKLSLLAMDHPEIEEVDVNPLFAGVEGVMAADALIILQDRGVTDPKRRSERHG
jgi:acetate---CoA ligase (ADP-forming)